MAYNKGCVVGRVIEINGGDKFDVVVVLDRAKPQYPNEIACEFFGKSRELLRDVSVGDWVTVEGSIRSNKSPSTGRRFTNFACYAISHIDVSQPDERGQQHREVRVPSNTKPVDDDLPF